MASTLRIDISPLQDAVLVKLSGEARLDLDDAAFQLDRIIAFQPKVIVVDASSFTFISSVGMSLLVNLHRAVAKSGGHVKLAGLLPFVRDAMNHARLIELFQVFPDVPAALATISPPLPAN